jgi:hypothetical protein
MSVTLMSYCDLFVPSSLMDMTSSFLWNDWGTMKVKWEILSWTLFVCTFPYKLIRPYDRCGLSWFGLTQIRPYIKWMFRPYHIFMRLTANPALYQMDVPALSYIYAAYGKSGLISNGCSSLIIYLCGRRQIRPYIKWKRIIKKKIKVWSGRYYHNYRW